MARKYHSHDVLRRTSDPPSLFPYACMLLEYGIGGVFQLYMEMSLVGGWKGGSGSVSRAPNPLNSCSTYAASSSSEITIGELTDPFPCTNMSVRRQGECKRGGHEDGRVKFESRERAVTASADRGF